MKFKSILQNILFVCILFSLTSIVHAQSMNNTTMGEQLEKQLFKSVMEKNWQAVEGMISPAFQSLNADKIRERNAIIDYVKSLQFEKYDFSDFHVTQNVSGNILVVTYEMTYAEKVDSHSESGRRVKNLSVWENNHGKWEWIAHAVID